MDPQEQYSSKPHSFQEQLDDPSTEDPTPDTLLSVDTEPELYLSNTALRKKQEKFGTILLLLSTALFLGGIMYWTIHVIIAKQLKRSDKSSKTLFGPWFFGLAFPIAALMTITSIVGIVTARCNKPEQTKLRNGTALVHIIGLLLLLGLESLKTLILIIGISRIAGWFTLYYIAVLGFMVLYSFVPSLGVAAYRFHLMRKLPDQLAQDS